MCAVGQVKIHTDLITISFSKLLCYLITHSTEGEICTFTCTCIDHELCCVKLFEKSWQAVTDYSLASSSRNIPFNTQTLS